MTTADQRTAELDRAFRDLVDALEAAAHRNERAIERSRSILAQRSAGRGYRDLVNDETPPLVVELMTQNFEALAAIGGRVRRLEAAVLHDEGYTMDEIARLFGVTRQRVSALIREARKG